MSDAEIVSIAIGSSALFLVVWDILMKPLIARRKQLGFIRRMFVDWLGRSKQEYSSSKFAATVLYEIADRCLKYGTGHLSYDEVYRLAVGASYLKRRLDDNEVLSQMDRTRQDRFFQNVIAEFVKDLRFLRLPKYIANLPKD